MSKARRQRNRRRRLAELKARNERQRQMREHWDRYYQKFSEREERGVRHV